MDELRKAMVEELQGNYKGAINEIAELRYIRKSILPLESPGGLKTAVVIKRDGSVRRICYKASGNAIEKSETRMGNPEDVEKLLQRLDDCIRNANSCVTYMDDAEEKLELRYASGEKITFPRGFGIRNDELGGSTVGKILKHFIEEIFPDWWRRD